MLPLLVVWQLAAAGVHDSNEKVNILRTSGRADTQVKAIERGH